MDKVLVLDEDDLLLKMFSKVLTLMGYEPFVTRDSAKALELLPQHDFRVVILEVFLSEADGLRIVQAIRDNNPKIHIIAMAGGSCGGQSAATIKDIKRQGADKVLRKPVEMHTLKQCLKTICSKDVC